MSGILDTKTRILDVIITDEGKAQIAAGKLKPAFYSFSDYGVIYVSHSDITDENGNSIDYSNRVFLESSNLPQDTITHAADDSGKLVKFPGSTQNVINGKIFEEFLGSDNIKRFLPLTGSQFASQIDGIIESTIDNFNKLYILGSPDIVLDERRMEFVIGINGSTSFIVNENISSVVDMMEANVDNINSFFQDKRLSHIPNFLFLPPVNKTNLSPIGVYMDITSGRLSKEELEKELKKLEDNGYTFEVVFLQSSRLNNILCQFFEIDNSEAIKLDVIDFGQVIINNIKKHVFFCGKIYTDSNEIAKYVHLFTLVFE